MNWRPALPVIGWEGEASNDVELELIDVGYAEEGDEDLASFGLD